MAARATASADFDLDDLLAELDDAVLNEDRADVNANQEAEVTDPEGDVGDVGEDTCEGENTSANDGEYVDENPSDGAKDKDSAGETGPELRTAIIKRKKQPQPPTWVKTIVADTFVDTSRDLLVNKNLNSLDIRVHSLICSGAGLRSILDATVTLKFSILPLPANKVALRSVDPKDCNTDIAEDQRVFDFAKKAVSLSMACGDVRSRAFRDGACPRICIELPTAGAGPVCATEVFLPALCSLAAGPVSVGLFCEALPTLRYSLFLFLSHYYLFLHRIHG